MCTIADYAIRIEFQARGSPHAHCVIWIKDAPKHIESPDSIVCDFIDQYISCKLPAEDGKLRELVQQHLIAKERELAVSASLSHAAQNPHN